MKIHKIKAIGWKLYVYVLEWTHKKWVWRIGLYGPKWIEILRPSGAWYRWKRILFNCEDHYIDGKVREVRFLCFGCGYRERK